MIGCSTESCANTGNGAKSPISRMLAVLLAFIAFAYWLKTDMLSVTLSITVVRSMYVSLEMPGPKKVSEN